MYLERTHSPKNRIQPGLTRKNPTKNTKQSLFCVFNFFLEIFIVNQLCCLTKMDLKHYNALLKCKILCFKIKKNLFCIKHIKIRKNNPPKNAMWVECFFEENNPGFWPGSGSNQHTRIWIRNPALESRSLERQHKIKCCLLTGDYKTFSSGVRGGVMICPPKALRLLPPPQGSERKNPSCY